MLKKLLSELEFSKIDEILNNYSDKKKREQKINEFVKIVVGARNHYTHYADFKLKNEVYLMKELKCIVELCFMKELGLSNNEIEEITKDHNRFNVYHNIYITSLI
jgi:hypothetical protein